MAIRAELFKEMGGFDSDAFPEDLFGIDLCLRLRETGKRVVVLPHIELIRRHHRRGHRKNSANELVRFRARWQKYEELDPFCNPNLKRDGSFEIDT
jgi:GT2 family glycosyltransferase